MYDGDYVRLTALRRDAMPFFPNASHWAELRRPFRAFTAISLQPSAGQQLNISTTQRPQGIQGLKARIISAPSRKGGGLTSGPCSEG